MADSTCPYCNAVLEVLPPPTASGKYPCPRCGEAVAPERWPASTSAPQPEASPAAAPTSLAQRKNKTLTAVLSIMAAMFTVALIYALATVEWRKLRHPRPRAAFEPVAVRSPLELPALRYLPTQALAIGGIHVAETLEDASGKELLAEPRPAQIERVLRPLLKSTGLTLAQIDHLAFAVVETHEPHLALVVRTRLPYDLRMLAQAVQPARSDSYKDRTTFAFGLKPAGEVLLWALDDKTLAALVGFDTPKSEHLQSFTEAPGEWSLTPALRELAEQRIPKTSWGWAVGDLTRWEGRHALLAFAPPGMKDLARVEQFALSARLQGAVTLLTDLRTPGPEASASLKAWIERGELTEGVKRTVVVPPPDQPQWVSVQTRASVAALRAWLDVKK